MSGGRPTVRPRLTKAMHSTKIQKYLKGVQYPARRQALLDRASGNDAPEEAVRALESLPDILYESPAQVTKEMADNNR